jgi:hypothetical protein
MASITLDKKTWLKHLGQFQSNINDLCLVVYENPSCLGYGVGYQTHFYRMFEQYPDATNVKAGKLEISDLAKVCAFLKKCDGSVTIKQTDGGKTLYVYQGKLKMNMPVTDIKSNKIVKNYETLVKKSQEDDWNTFGGNEHKMTARTKLAEIVKLAGLSSLVSKNADYTVSVNTDAGEISVSMGKQHSTKVFAISDLTDVDAIAGSGEYQSSFGPWLLPCLSLVNPNMTSRIHFGDSTALIIRQTSNTVQRLLIIIDQQV